MEKQKLVKIGAIGGGAVLIVLLLFGAVKLLGVRLPFLPGGQPPESLRPTPVPSDSDIIVSQPVSESGKTLRTTFKDDRFYYALQGRFSGELQSLGDHLIGEVTIDDDSTGMKFPVEIRPGKDDQYILVRYTTVFAEGRERLNFVTADEFIAAITPDTPVQLRLMYPATVEQTAEEVYLQDFFEALIEGQPFTPKRVTIRPVAVGILEE